MKVILVNKSKQKSEKIEWENPNGLLEKTTEFKDKYPASTTMVLNDQDTTQDVKNDFEMWMPKDSYNILENDDCFKAGASNGTIVRKVSWTNQGNLALFNGFNVKPFTPQYIQDLKEILNLIE